MKAMRPNTIKRTLSGCDGKERFMTFGRAARTAHRQAQNKKGKFSAYHCQYCGGFHVGTQLAKQQAMGSYGDSRYPFAVFARENAGREQLVGWSATLDGGKVAEIIAQEPGWTVSRVEIIRRRAA
jgi:hypothetical protein